LEDTVKLPLLDEVLPGGLRYGANYLVEFEPQSLWFEASLTLCAQALRRGIRTDYHTFTHPPGDIRRQLTQLWVEVDRLEADDTFRIVDSYTVQTGIGAARKVGNVTTMNWVDLKTLRMEEWDKGTVSALKKEVPEIEKKRLHIDDNTAVLVQFNDEKKVSEHFRTLVIPFARHLGLAAIHSAAAGIFSDSFYRQFESFCDGIIDIRAQERGSKIVHSIRVRVARGASHDSTWRELRLLANGEVGTDKGLGLAVPPSNSGSGLSEEVEGERRLSAIMFTDVVGFTSLAQRNESLALELLGEQKRFFRPILAKHRGREVKTMGDAFLVEFASGLDAIRCAAEIQSALKDANAGRPEGRRMVVRIGIHIGDVVHTGSDLAGDAVNVASRIEPLAPPGGICVTGPVYASVVNKVEQRFESMGTPRLKNVETPIEVFRVVGYGQPTPAPFQGSDTPLKQRIAVLPLTNISQDRGDEYFADGMTEELISSVSKTPGLRVIARTSVMKYKGMSKSISEIGRELNVGSVLEGSVRKAGEKVRITVQLVQTSNEEPTWSQDYDREIRDIFSIQGDIAKQVAEALRAEVLGVAGGEKTANSEAYVNYLRGRQAWNRRNQEGLNQAIDFFQRALRIDGSYAKAYTGLADSFATLALLEFSAPNEVYPKAKEAVSKALSLDPGLAEAHTSLGLIRFQYDWDWGGAEEEFREAIRLNPSYAPAHHFFADYLKALGRFDEALAEISRAQGLDPLNLAINTGVGHVLYLSRQYDRAIEQYKKAVDLDPSFMATHVWFGRPYLEKGMYAEAISELETAVRLSGESTLALAMLGHGLASAGRKEEALKVMEKLEERSKHQYVPSYWIAVIYNGFRDREQVAAWLRKAYEERSSWLVWCNVEPRFAWLKGDPEFSSLISAMKFP
jgi:class 3 adenylate cyclase/tetratricopeptide (TPR) repeat protein